MVNQRDGVEGAPVWAELVSYDRAASAAFYGGLLGWKADAAGFTLADMRVAGIASGGSEWRLYLRVSDVDAAAAAAEEAGGQVYLAPPTGDLGRAVLMTDPTGAEVGAIQADSPRGFEHIDAVGGAVWHELHTDSFDRAVPFYERVFGWEPQVLGDDDSFRMSTLGGELEATAGIYDASATLGRDSSHWQHYFSVADADASAALIVDLGGTVLGGPEDTPYGRTVHAKDSLGAHFSLMQTPER